MPEPTPTPTPAPQGPVDVRSGVPIAPRSIPEQTAAPTPSPAPAQEEPLIDVPIGDLVDPASESTDAPDVVTASPESSANQQIQPQGGVTPRVTPQGPSQSVEPEISPAQTADSAPASSIDALGSPAIDLAPAPDTAGDPDSTSTAPSTFPGWLWALGTLVLAIIAGAIALILRSRKARTSAPTTTSVPATVLARDTLSPKPSADTEEVVARPTSLATEAPSNTASVDVPAKPALDVELDVVSATRSLMMLTVDCRISLANQSDHAARNISLSGSLVCAQRSATGNASGETSSIPHTIERIGPHQSGVVTMQMQLPLSQIQPIRQGQKPLCIPLAQVTLEAQGAASRTHSFVIGSPSLANPHRLHPIPLDTPPGGIPGLLAREVKTDGASARAA